MTEISGKPSLPQAVTQQLLGQVVSGSPGSVAVFDRNLNYLLVSRRYLADYHLEQPAIIGRCHYDVFPDIPDRWKAVHRRCLAGATESATEDPFTRGDGSVDWVNWEIQPWYDDTGAIGGIILFSEVVTGRKLRQEQIQRSEALFRATFEQAAVGIAHVAPDGHFLRINQKLCSTVGYSYEELLGLSFQDITHPEDLAEDLEYVRRLLAGEVDEYSLEKRYLHKDGTIIWVNLTVALVRDAAGRPDYFLSVIESIDKRKRAEEKNRKLEEKLRQYQKMEAIGRLAGGVAHDLNNLLTPILSYGEMLAMDPGLGSGQQKAMAEILRAAERARDLVGQLLAFGRKQPLNFKPLDLNTTVESFAKLLRRTIPENISLRIELAPEIRNILADSGQVEQIIMNLAVNAADAMPTGGELLLATGLTDLADDLAGFSLPPGRYVTLAISDTGIGMDQETQERIFEPFFSTKGDKGTGLGLATVFSIVQQHGGNIWVYSEPGQGSTFRIYLPVTDQVRTEPAVARVLADDRGGHETIMLVEDNQQVRQMARTILEMKGYKVHEAADGESALKILAALDEPVGLLVTDVVLPGVNGKQLYERVVQSRPALKVLLMSGYSNDIIAQQGALPQGVHFIQKPFSSRALTARVRTILDGEA